MKQSIVISIILLFLTGSSFGQQFKFQSINDSLEFEKFYSYVNSILELKSDVSTSDSLSNYKLIYRTSCHNSEVLYSDETLYSTEGKSFSNYSISFKSQVSYGTKPLKKIAPYYCAEKPSKLLGELPFTIIKEQIIVSNDSLVDDETGVDSFETIRIYNKVSEYVPYGLVRFSSCTNFEHGKYIIIEFFSTTGIGSQTSPGITETLFLERIE